jgi:hypothetical protein
MQACALRVTGIASTQSNMHCCCSLILPMMLGMLRKAVMRGMCVLCIATLCATSLATQPYAEQHGINNVLTANLTNSPCQPALADSTAGPHAAGVRTMSWPDVSNQWAWHEAMLLKTTKQACDSGRGGGGAQQLLLGIRSNSVGNHGLTGAIWPLLGGCVLATAGFEQLQHLRRDMGEASW